METQENAFLLCSLRHDTPEFVSKCIFPNQVDPEDVTGLTKLAYGKVKKFRHVEVIVTGLTVALVALINACCKSGTALTLRHHTPDGRYIPQHVWVLKGTSQIGLTTDYPMEMLNNGVYLWETTDSVHEYDPITSCFRSRSMYTNWNPWLDEYGNQFTDIQREREVCDLFERM